MSRRSLPPRKPEAELSGGAALARHRLGAGPGDPDSGRGMGSGSGLLEPLPDGPPPVHPSSELRPGTPGVRSRTGLRAAALLGVFAAVLGCWFWWQAAAGAPAVVPLGEVSSAGVQLQDPVPHTDSSTAQEGSVPAPARITVHVAGAVVHPGVLELPVGSRLHEALTAAGGPTAVADPDRLNLAAVLEDGQKILVPERGQPEAAAGEADNPGDTGSAGTGTAGSGVPAAGGGGGGSGSRINLNTAGVEELGTLPRVGPVLAQRIVDWRKQHGRFQKVDELDAVGGIGPKLLEALLPLVRV